MNQVILLTLLFFVIDFAIAEKRCGNTDAILSRSKRFVLKQGGGHVSRNVTYKISKYTNQLSKQDVDDVIRKSFDAWTHHTDLRFTKKDPSEEADIDLRFEIGDTHCEFPFDGAIAHAHKTMVHFNDAEHWVLNNNREKGVYLFGVAVHEIGHSLGLGHSSIEGTIMFPWYNNETTGNLHEDDISGIQDIYQKRKDKSNFNLDLCIDPTFDAIFQSEDNKVYILKGSYYYEVSGVSVQKPQLITNKWIGLPDDIDAAFSQNGNTYFFKEGYYWRYTNYKKDDRYPVRLDHYYSEIPNYLNSAMVWHQDNKVYFFRQKNYYVMNNYNEQYTNVTNGIIETDWKGIPNEISAAFSYNHQTYFFKGDSFYLYDATSKSATGPYKTISYWFNCAKH